MNILKRFLTVIFISSLCASANAYVVTDVRTFDRIIHVNDTFHWLYDLPSLGFVVGRDTLVSEIILTLELRDPKYHQFDSGPTVGIFIDQGVPIIKYQKKILFSMAAFHLQQIWTYDSVHNRPGR